MRVSSMASPLVCFLDREETSEVLDVVEFSRKLTFRQLRGVIPKWKGPRKSSLPKRIQQFLHHDNVKNQTQHQKRRQTPHLPPPMITTSYSFTAASAPVFVPTCSKFEIYLLLLLSLELSLDLRDLFAKAMGTMIASAAVPAARSNRPDWDRGGKRTDVDTSADMLV